MGGDFRYFVGALAFGFAAVWIMATLAGALVCAAAGLAGYGGAVMIEWARNKRFAHDTRPEIPIPSKDAQPTRKAGGEEFPLTPEALNNDLGYVYEPTGALTTHTDEYGWSRGDSTARSDIPPT